MKQEQIQELRGCTKGKRLRLVYRVDKTGRPACFIHLENIQKVRAIQIITYVLNAKRQVTVDELHKKLKVNRSSLQRLADKLAGVLWIDKQDESGVYQKVCRGIVDVRKGQFNKKANIKGVPPYLKYKPPYIFCPRTA